MKPRVSMRKALSDRKLLGKAISGDSWRAWRILLIAAVGEKLTDSEREVFKKLTGRDREPLEPAHELVVIAGRRGGKSLAMAVLLCWIAGLCDHRDVLAPGEVGVALCISRDQRIAKIILNYCEGILDTSPVLRSLVRNRTADAIELSNNISVEVRPANYKTLRGPTYICIVADEIAHWFTSVDFANPDVEILAAVRPGLMTTRGPLLMVSSAYGKSGELYDAFKKYYGPEGPSDILVAYGSSRTFNPTLPQAEIDRALDKDPVRNRAEYLSEWRLDTEGFISRAVVESCVGDHRELPPQPGIHYFCFTDAATGCENGDSYAIAISHRQGDQIIIDAVREIIPQFSPFGVVENVLIPLCRAYQITHVRGDNFAGNIAQEPIRKAGLSYNLSPKHKSDLYRDALLPALNSSKVVLPMNDRLVNQICSLERSVLRSGRDTIDHPTHGHDDLANAVAGAVAIAAIVRQEIPIVPPVIVSAGPRYIPGQYSESAMPTVSPHSPHRPSSEEPWARYVARGGYG